MSASKTTTDHNKIKQWAEERQGKPAVVKGTENNEDGSDLLFINFPGYAEDNLKDISWDEFFETFDDRDLAFLYQDEIEGKKSRFFKLVDREN